MSRFLLSVLLITLLTSLCQASPYQAILYPEGATLFERKDLASGVDQAVLYLPQVAQPDSLRASLDDESQTSISSVEYSSVLPETQDFIPLRDKIAALKKQLNELDDQAQATQLVLSYWQKQTPKQDASVQEALELSKAIQAQSLAQLQTQSRLNQEKSSIREQIAEAQRQLDEQTGQNSRRWKVTLQLSAPLKNATSVHYDYRIRQAGWSSSYSLNALPREKRIEWIWNGQIVQTSGQNWPEIRILVATAEPVFSLTPPDNSPWVLSEIRPQPRPAMKTLANRQYMAAEAMLDDEVATSAPLPQRRAGQIFDLYDLGRLSLASGKAAIVNIRSGRWGAEFSYLTRPLQTEQAFLMAEVLLGDDVVPLPEGNASIQLEGVHVGQRSFSLAGKQELKLSFGNDPAIAIDVKTAHVAGSRGLLSKNETYSWNWSVTLKNNKSIPVRLTVEDSLPHSSHDRIVVKEQFTEPLPEKTDDGLLSWQFDLASGNVQKLTFGYQVSYPEDMQIDKGR